MAPILSFVVADFLTQHRGMPQLIKEQRFNDVLVWKMPDPSQDHLPRVHERLQIVSLQPHGRQVCKVVQRTTLLVELVVVVHHPQDLPTLQHVSLLRCEFIGEHDASAQLAVRHLGQRST